MTLTLAPEFVSEPYGPVLAREAGQIVRLSAQQRRLLYCRGIMARMTDSALMAAYGEHPGYRAFKIFGLANQ